MLENLGFAKVLFFSFFFFFFNEAQPETVILLSFCVIVYVFVCFEHQGI